MKPILFNTEMVSAILDGSKTVTRRCVKPKFEGRYYPIWDYPERLIFEKSTNPYDWWQIWIDHKGNPYTCTKPPYFVGDILYVRETWANPYKTGYKYKADYYDEHDIVPNNSIFNSISVSANMIKWKPSIHMPKEAARIFLRVTNVTVARLQDITEGQAKAEGAITVEGSFSAVEIFQSIWDSTIKRDDYWKYSWEVNPWVWIIEFERIDKPNV